MLGVQIILSVIAIAAFDFFFFGPTYTSTQSGIFVVPKASENFDAAAALKKQGFVRSEWLTRMILAGQSPEPGGYRLHTNMWVWQVTKTVSSPPPLVWVTFAGCFRREQMGEMLAQALSWDQKKSDEWNSAYKTLGVDYEEGVYYPDTYLLPTDESGAVIAKRFIDHFQEKFAPLSQQFLDANIRWVTALKIASLIEREAGGVSDMKLIAGIIWNRLNTGMRLQIDATMQYTRGPSAGSGATRNWWGSIDLSEMQRDSPYNTYLYTGLPPTPICSPSITSIEAVLHPEETDCLYYLHDKNREIHCTKTYAEHLKNIELYLN